MILSFSVTKVSARISHDKLMERPLFCSESFLVHKSNNLGPFTIHISWSTALAEITGSIVTQFEVMDLID